VTRQERTERASYLPRSISLSSPDDRFRSRFFLQVNQQLSEGPALAVGPELADPLGSLEVGQYEGAKQFGAGSRWGLEASADGCSISSKFMERPHDSAASHSDRRRE
jgi:hypothetical protein